MYLNAIVRQIGTPMYHKLWENKRLSYVFEESVQELSAVHLKYQYVNNKYQVFVND